MDAVSDRAVAYPKLWRHLVPYFVVTKPMTDLCWTCQQNSSALTRAINTPLAEKSAALSAYMEHLEAAHKERSFYKMGCDLCRTTIQSQGGQFTPPPLSSCTAPNSVDIQSHYLRGVVLRPPLQARSLLSLPLNQPAFLKATLSKESPASSEQSCEYDLTHQI